MQFLPPAVFTFLPPATTISPTSPHTHLPAGIPTCPTTYHTLCHCVSTILFKGCQAVLLFCANYHATLPLHKTLQSQLQAPYLPLPATPLPDICSFLFHFHSCTRRTRDFLASFPFLTASYHSLHDCHLPGIVLPALATQQTCCLVLLLNMPATKHYLHTLPTFALLVSSLLPVYTCWDFGFLVFHSTGCLPATYTCRSLLGLSSTPDTHHTHHQFTGWDWNHARGPLPGLPACLPYCPMITCYHHLPPRGACCIRSADTISQDLETIIPSSDSVANTTMGPATIGLLHFMHMRTCPSLSILPAAVPTGCYQTFPHLPNPCKHLHPLPPLPACFLPCRCSIAVTHHTPRFTHGPPACLLPTTACLPADTTTLCHATYLPPGWVGRGLLAAPHYLLPAQCLCDFCPTLFHLCYHCLQFVLGLVLLPWAALPACLPCHLACQRCIPRKDCCSPFWWFYCHHYACLPAAYLPATEHLFQDHTFCCSCTTHTLCTHPPT